MVGIPDGLGLFNSSKTQFTVLMNHEITNGATVSGSARHGSKGRLSRAGRSIGTH